MKKYSLFLFAIILLSTIAVFPQAAAQPKFANMGIMIDGDVITHNLPRPSLESLKAAGYVTVGIGVLNFYRSQQDLASLTAYLTLVHKSNLTAFTMLYGNTQTTLTYALLAAKLGFDSIDLDEPLGQAHLNTTELLTVIHTVTAQYPRIRFVITEFTQSTLQTVYAAVGNLTNVDVAEDSYSDQIVLKGNVGMAAKYHKVPYVWLIVVPTKANYDCSKNFNDWLNLASQQKAAPIMFLVDSAGKWLNGPLNLKASPNPDTQPTVIIPARIPLRILERKLTQCGNATRSLICWN